MPTPTLPDRFAEIRNLLGTLTNARLLTALRPDKYLRMVAAIRHEGMTTTSGIALSARRCPDRLAIIDEIGSLTWKQLDERCNALASALLHTPPGVRGLGVARAAPQTVGIMCRNHRGFVEALAAANRVGADVLLLNTSFAGPALADVVNRENVDTIFYDEEFTAAVNLAVADDSTCRRILAWTDTQAPVCDGPQTVEELITAHSGQKPIKSSRVSKLILLTSGTTGKPKGARRPGTGGGGVSDIQGILDRVPWRAEEPVVIVAPMFHAWGFSQLALSTLMACTVVTRRKFDPEATLELIDRSHATGLVVVPVMLDRIIEMPEKIREKYSGRSLRFATASGSRMRPDVVTAFMDRFGDIIYNNYNATEAGIIAIATPQDLRAAPDTAGTAADGTDVRILDSALNDVPIGSVGQIFVRNSSQFDGYTGGGTKEFHEGFMASGDIGQFDCAGRLFVVGRDDEMIVSGGENVYPLEIEKSLSSHADVMEASVIGVDDKVYGQRLAAFVVLHEKASATPETLKTHVRDNLANYKVLREITILGELPRSSTGKVLRSDLQARAAAATKSIGEAPEVGAADHLG